MSNIIIEKFGDRLNSIVRCLVHETLIIRDETYNILVRDDIHHAMQADPDVNARDERTWYRVMQTGKVPAEYLQFIYSLYPTVRGVLEGQLDRFEEFIGPKLAARMQWERAMDHMAHHRHDRLNGLAKRYYSEVDETENPDFPIKNFPLVAKANWILEKPALLNEAEQTDLPPIHLTQLPEPPKLSGIDVSALALKSSVTLRKRKRRTGGAFWNGATYRMIGIERDGDNLRFEFGNGTYFDYINGCEARALELAHTDLLSNGEIDSQLMPIRVGPSDIFNFLGRASFPGVNCLTILKNYREPNAMDGEHDVYLVHYRDDTVMEAQNCVHVVPAGGHQPISDDTEDSFCSQVWLTAGREFLEELRGYPDLDRHDRKKFGRLKPGQVPEFDILFRSEVNGRKVANIYLLGVGIDPVTTKPEILVAIVLDWHLASIKLENLRIRANYEGQVRPVRFRQTIAERKEQLRKEASGLLHSPWGKPLPTLAAGAACFLLAAEHFESLV